MPIRYFALALSCLFLAPAHAGASTIWTEVGDAGNLLGTAQVAFGSGALTQIDGAINDPTEALGAGNDRDMYLIYVSDPTNFEATTAGGTTLDTQLFLFSALGGVTFNDDDPTGLGGLRSRLTGAFVTTAGLYYLAISRFDRDPTCGGAEIWSDTPYNVERAPDGPGAGCGPLDGWNGLVESNLIGNYSIFLTGAEFVPTAVPEPATLLLLGTGLGAVAARRRLKKRA